MQKNYLLRKGLAVGLILLLIGTSVIPITAQDAEKPLPTSRGNWLYVGGSGPGNYTKIQDAIDNATDGDTVFVFNGTYYENVEINKTIHLNGENRNTTIIDGGMGYETDVVSVSANLVNISQFSITHSGYGGSSGIKIHSNFVTVFGNIISNNDYAGIRIIKSSIGSIIIDNNISNNRLNGIFSDGDSTTIYSNDILANGRAIWMYQANNSIISNNFISKNDDGILIGFPGSYNIISNNSIESNNNDGIRIWDSRNNMIFGNIIRNHTRYGIYILVASENNRIYYNNFINNFQNAYDECANHWNNSYPSGGNYWSDYMGSDTLNGPLQDIQGPDGVGDTPYQIPGGSSQDQYPLMLPYGMTQLAFTFHVGFGFSGTITNVGNTTAFMVCFQQTVEGGFILRGRHSLFVAPKPLLPGEEVFVKSRMIFGFGKIQLTIAIWADNAPYIERTSSATVILFFIIGLH